LCHIVCVSEENKYSQSVILGSDWLIVITTAT